MLIERLPALLMAMPDDLTADLRFSPAELYV
jgi:hypothetical protein